ncbi:MAG: hypothetical protein HGA39_09380 [Coriobacteriia bacterium]|nr:hypothetical protein [Coriobacteriia bacterium]
MPHDMSHDGASGREEELERALSGGLRELPPNKTRGLLGEVNPSLQKAEDYTPDLNAGVSQENDWPVVWLAIVLCYLIFFPLAYVILWRSRFVSRRAKIVVSIVGALGVGYAIVRLVAG